MTLSEELDRLVSRLEEAPELIIQAAFEVFSDHSVQEYIIFLQERQLYSYQVDASGAPMPLYSPKTIERYHKPCSNYNLYVTGKLYDSFSVDVDSEGVDFGPNTGYSDLYDYAYGLTPESMAKLKDYIQGPLGTALRNLIMQ